VGSNSSGQITNITSGSATFFNAFVGPLPLDSNNLLYITNSSLSRSANLSVGSGGSYNTVMITYLSVVKDAFGGIGGVIGALSNSVKVDGGTWVNITNNGTGLSIGRSGSSSSLVVTNGGSVQLYASSLIVGQALASSNNIVTVTGIGSQILVSSNNPFAGNNIRIGQLGSGNSMIISSGGSVTVFASSGSNAIGFSGSSSNNSVLVTGENSTWSNANSLYIGDGGSGTLTVANGGTFLGSGIIIASQPGSIGTLNIGSYGGTDTAGTIVAPMIAVGWGSGTLNFNQTDTATLTSSIIGVGTIQQFGSGTTILSGDNSQFTGTTTISAGVLSAASTMALGTSAVTLANTGVLALSTKLTISSLLWNAGSSSIALPNLADGAFLNITGALNLSGTGTFNLTNDTLGGSTYELMAWGNTGGDSYGTNNFTVTGLSDGYTLSISNNALYITAGSVAIQDLYVGSNTSGVSTSFLSGTNSYSNTTIGYNAGDSNNSLTVANMNTLLTNSANLYVGYSGSSNSMVISNGGTVAVAGYGYIGDQTISTNNSLVVTGSNSVLAISGADGMGNGLTVGYNGNSCSLILSNGASVNLTNCLTIDMWSDAPSNSVIIAGSSTLTSGGLFVVGWGAAGNSLLVTNGGVINNTGSAYIGMSSSSNSATVTGSGSLWSNSGSMTIGNSGSGTLTVANQGALLASGITIAANAGSIGTLNIGSLGGTDGAGSITAPTITFGSGSGTLNFNQIDTATLTSSISGAGTVDQFGTGTTILTGNSSYSGGTLITNGTLSIMGTNSGTGSITVSGGTFAGTGAATQSAVTLSGGAITPGTGGSVGTLSIGSLTITGGSLNIFLGGDGGASTSLLAANGSVSLGGTLSFTTNSVLTGSLYTFLTDTNGTITGTFSATNGIPAGYQVVYTSNSVYLTVAGSPFTNAQAVFAGTNSMITGGSTNFLISLSNSALAGNFVFTGTNGSNTAGSIGSTTLTAQTATNTAGLSFTGTNVGAAQTGSVTLNSTAPSSSSTNLTVTVDVYGHASGSISSTNLTLSNWIVGYTGGVASTNSVTLSNAAGFNVALGATNNSGGTITNISSLGAGSTTTLGASLSASGIGTGTYSSNVTVTFADASSLAGASTNLGSTNLQITGNVYGHASGSISATNVSLGNAIVGYSPISTNLTLSNAAGFNVALKATGSTNGNFSLAGASSLTQGTSTDAALTLSSGQGTGTFSNSVTMVYGDASTLNGASTNLGTNTVVVTGAIYDHASAQLGSSTLFLGAHVGYSNAFASGGSITLSNASGFRVALSSSNGVSSNSRVTLDHSGNLTAGASTNLFAHLAAGQGVGVFTNVIGVTFADSSALNGASTDLGSTNITLLGSVYTGKGVWVSANGGNWTDLSKWQLQGGTPGIDGALSANDTATFGTNGSGTVTLNTKALLSSLTFSNASAPYLISGSGTIVLQGAGSLNNLAGSNSIATALTAATNVSLSNNALLNISGNIGGSGTLLNLGSGTTILSGSNSNTGPTIVSKGYLEILNTNSLSAGTSLTVSNGATLILGMGTNSTRAFSGANFSSLLGSLTRSTNAGLFSGSSIGADVTGTNVTISGAITNRASNAIGLSLFGNGTLTLTATNTYSGPTTISAGTLQVGNGGLAGSTGGGAITDNASLVYDLSGNAYNSFKAIGNSISGSGSLTLCGGDNYVLTCSNSFSGGISLNGVGLFITNDASLGGVNGAISLNGGELITAVSSGSLLISSNRTITLGTNGGSLNAWGGGPRTIASQITGCGSLSIAWDHGVLNLAGSNNYTGTTTIGSSNVPYWFHASGYTTVLQLGGSYALPSCTVLNFGTNDFNDRSELDLNGYNATVSMLNGGSNALILNTNSTLSQLSVNNNGWDSFGGSIMGNTALQLTGSGTLNLSGIQTYTGGTTISSGSLMIANNSSLSGPVSIAGPSSVLTLNPGASLTSPMATYLISGTLIDNSGLTFAKAIKGTVKLNSTGVLQKSYAAGSSVAGFGATLNGLNQSFQLLAGAVQQAATLTAKIMGGALDFKGTYSNGVVMSITSSNFSLAGTHTIQWMNTNAPGNPWTNTIAGDTGVVTNAAYKDFKGSYASFLSRFHITPSNGLTNIMGAYGFDTNTSTAWAVINHNSLFSAPFSFLGAGFSYTQFAQNQNQTNVATALNSFIPATSGDQQTIVTSLDSLTASEYNQAFNAYRADLLPAGGNGRLQRGQRPQHGTQPTPLGTPPGRGWGILDEWTGR
jgi:T5SS/PEP-CTERM-associated repeat protein/autotransporter-associated beta strand protein